jgi:hypothetical protein
VSFLIVISEENARAAACCEISGTSNEGKTGDRRKTDIHKDCGRHLT